MPEVPQIPEGLSLDEHRMRQAYYARTASRLPAGSEERRSALEQVRLSERMIDCLTRQDKAKPRVSLPALPPNGIESDRGQASTRVWGTAPNVLGANGYHQKTLSVFIELTQLNGNSVLININSIRNVMADAERSLLTFSDSAAPSIPVRESYTEVLKKLCHCGALIG